MFQAETLHRSVESKFKDCQVEQAFQEPFLFEDLGSFTKQAFLDSDIVAASPFVEKPYTNAGMRTTARTIDYRELDQKRVKTIDMKSRQSKFALPRLNQTEAKPLKSLVTTAATGTRPDKYSEYRKMQANKYNTAKLSSTIHRD